MVIRPFKRDLLTLQGCLTKSSRFGSFLEEKWIPPIFQGKSRLVNYYNLATYIHVYLCRSSTPLLGSLLNIKLLTFNQHYSLEEIQSLPHQFIYGGRLSLKSPGFLLMKLVQEFRIMHLKLFKNNLIFLWRDFF